jgi:hypothetical protein
MEEVQNKSFKQHAIPSPESLINSFVLPIWTLQKQRNVEYPINSKTNRKRKDR